ncbi:FG-GAP-like repeat-containing protein, partial [Ekhidna sp.]|uniref:FG-GAP-like repeat-containing protein n=1 Tax=Ekhidna sp. TaxID=2608089 RepID=UPI0032EDC222
MNHYQRHLLNSTRAKYFKYKSRIEKNIANGTFQTMPRRKKRSLISKVEKFGKRLERWNMSLRGAMVAGSIAGASIMPNLATAQIDPNIYLNQSSSVSISPPRDIVAINIDQDEELELIVSTSNGGEVGNWDGKDSYEFSAPNSLTYARQLLLVGDIDGDSDMDLIFTNNGDGTYLYKGINTGVGAITSTYIGYSNRPDDIQLVDWDSDGDLDIVIASGYNYLKVFENDGSGNFSPYGGETGIFDLGGVGTIGGEGNIDSFTFADFDDDGDMDLIHNAYYPFGPYYTGSIVVLENTRDAEGVPIFDTASPAYAYQVNYNQFNNIELLDFDGDGDLDIFFGGQGTAYALSNQYIQGSAFSFNSVGITSIGENTIDDVVSGDFDNDGNDELIIANGSYNRLFSFDGSILQGIGGNLGGEIGNMTSDNDALFVADLNGDDNLDLATISIRDGEVSTYFDQGAPSLSYFSGDLIVDENTPIGHRIGTFGFSDIQEDPITVALTGDDASFFNFDIGTGELTINAELDWESKGSDLDLFFEISDGNKSRVEGGTVKINNLAEDGHGTFDPNPIKLFGNREVDFFVSGDYDMDGDADVFLTSPNSQFYNSLLQQNGGSFTDVELSAFSGPQNYAAFVHTYGGLDLVVHDIGSSEVRLSQRSESGFVDYSTLQTGIGDVDKMITGDFDGDGLYEIAIQATNASGYAIVRTFEDSNDSWISNQYFLLSNDLSTGLLDGVGDFNEIEIADFNGDGYGDMLATTVNGNDVLFLGGEYLDGGGYGFSSSFFPVITDSDGGETELAIGDIDGKGSPDIAIMRWENNVNYQIHVDFHVNDGDGSFSLHQTIALGGEFWGNIDLADIDGDGDLDLITTNLKAVGVGGGEYDFTMSIETFTNDGSGYFTAFQHIEDAGGEAFKMMDVDGDDDLDIILHADIGAEAGGENQLKVFKNINVSPTSINLSSTDFDEHLPIDTEVATISVDDLNSGDNHILSLVTGDGSNDLHNSYFTLNGNSLRLTKNVKFEDTPQLNILLSANDGHQTYEQAMVINVNDVNQAPTAIELSATSFDEHTVGGTAIATISATDANGGDTHTFELITGDGSNDTDNSKFAIEGNQLIILEQIAFEDQNSLNVYLETTDSFGNSFEQALTVTVNNINTAPTGIQLSSTTFDEGIAGGTPVATLTADDVDSGDSHTFTLASGDGSNDADNSKFLIDGDQLVIKSSPNFETQDTYNIYLSASDSEGSAEAAFVLTVNNLNSTPT